MHGDDHQGGVVDAHRPAVRQSECSGVRLYCSNWFSTSRWKVTRAGLSLATVPPSAKVRVTPVIGKATEGGHQGGVVDGRGAANRQGGVKGSRRSAPHESVHGVQGDNHQGGVVDGHGAAVRQGEGDAGDGEGGGGGEAAVQLDNVLQPLELTDEAGYARRPKATPLGQHEDSPELNALPPYPSAPRTHR